jgi:hypothetical protein
MIRSVPANASDALYCMLLAQNAVHGAMVRNMDVYIYLYMNMYIYIYIYIFIYENVYIYVYIYVYVHIWINLDLFNSIISFYFTRYSPTRKSCRLVTRASV